MNRRRDARKDDAMNDLSHLGLGGQDKLKDDEDYAERMGVLTPLPLTDAAPLCAALARLDEVQG